METSSVTIEAVTENLVGAGALQPSAIEGVAPVQFVVEEFIDL